MEHGSQGQAPFSERVNHSATCYQDFNKKVKGPNGFNDKKVTVTLEFQWSVGVRRKISLSRKERHWILKSTDKLLDLGQDSKNRVLLPLCEIMLKSFIPMGPLMHLKLSE